MVSREQEEKILQETKLLVETFLMTRESDIDLGKRCNITSSTVGRRLTNKERIIAVFGENGEEIYNQIMAIRNDNLQKGKMIGSQTSMLNHIKEGEFVKTPKLLLGVFFNKPEKQEKFLYHLALTTRAKPQLLSELFGIDEDEICKIIEKVGGPLTEKSNKFYLELDTYNQEKARNRILNLYKDILLANKNKDKALKVSLIKEITDAKIVEFQKKWNAHLNGEKFIERKENKILTDEDIVAILNYQLKYSLTDYHICEQFSLNRQNYRERVRNYIQDNNELRCRYEELLDYNLSIKKDYGFNRGQM